MFNKSNASSAAKKAAYQKGFKGNWKWVPCGNSASQDPTAPFMLIQDEGGNETTLSSLDLELAQDYTWKELRS